MQRGYGSGSGVARGYAVEARCTYYSPTRVSDSLILDKEWRTLPLGKSSCSHVPTRNWCFVTDSLGLVNYKAAQAIAHLFLAEIEANLVTGAGCVECRIVEVEVTYSYGTKEIGVGDVINRTDGPREKFMPRDEVGELPLSAKATTSTADRG